MTVLKPTDDFDWKLVVWGAPDDTVAENCSYCGEPLGEDEMPLIMWNKAGWTVQFCENCQRKYWGLECLDDDGDDYETPE